MTHNPWTSIYGANKVVVIDTERASTLNVIILNKDTLPPDADIT